MPLARGCDSSFAMRMSKEPKSWEDQAIKKATQKRKTVNYTEVKSVCIGL
jgi:hypothetical protein